MLYIEISLRISGTNKGSLEEKKTSEEKGLFSGLGDKMATVVAAAAATANRMKADFVGKWPETVLISRIISKIKENTKKYSITMDKLTLKEIEQALKNETSPLRNLMTQAGYLTIGNLASAVLTDPDKTKEKMLEAITADLKIFGEQTVLPTFLDVLKNASSKSTAPSVPIALTLPPKESEKLKKYQLSIKTIKEGVSKCRTSIKKAENEIKKVKQSFNKITPQSPIVKTFTIAANKFMITVSNGPLKKKAHDIIMTFAALVSFFR